MSTDVEHAEASWGASILQRKIVGHIRHSEILTVEQVRLLFTTDW